MYPDSFNNYTPGQLILVVEQLQGTPKGFNTLSPVQRNSLLANLTKLRADTDQMMQSIDNAIQNLGDL